MLHRRVPSRYRKYMQAAPPIIQKNIGQVATKEEDTILSNIPLPNQIEKFDPPKIVMQRGDKSSFLNNLFGKITIEEVILIGLIFVMFEEGIEDELLLVVLIYLFLAGKD